MKTSCTVCRPAGASVGVKVEFAAVVEAEAVARAGRVAAAAAAGRHRGEAEPHRRIRALVAAGRSRRPANVSSRRLSARRRAKTSDTSVNRFRPDAPVQTNQYIRRISLSRSRRSKPPFSTVR